MTVEFSGIAGSEGIAAGKAYVYINNQTEIDTEAVSCEAINTELEKLNEGMELSKTQLMRLKEKVMQEFNESEAQIFEAHIMMLGDPEFTDAIRDAISSGSVNAA